MITLLEGFHARDLTFGPFKLIGVVSKGHPDEKDIAAAIEFYNGLTEQPVFLK